MDAKGWGSMALTPDVASCDPVSPGPTKVISILCGNHSLNKEIPGLKPEKSADPPEDETLPF